MLCLEKSNFPKRPLAITHTESPKQYLVNGVEFRSRIDPSGVFAFPIVSLCGREALLSPLLRKYLSADCQNSFKPLSSLYSVLLEALNAELLNLVLDPLPTTTKRDDLGILLEHRLSPLLGRSVNHSLLHAQEVRPGHVLAAHRHLLRLRVNVADLEHERDVTALAKNRLDP